VLKSIVRLTPEERVQLTALISKGHRAASVLARARILLKAAADEEDAHWTDADMATALETRASTVHRVRQACVEEGLTAALERRKPTGRPYRKLDGAQEAHRLALACSAPPAGRARWTRQLLADRLVAVHVVPSMSAECVRTTLKKMRSNPGNTNSG
jgi:Homeodomain-like domain